MTFALSLLRRPAAEHSGPVQRGAGPEFAPDVLASEVGACVAAAVQMSTSQKEPRCA